MKPVIALVGRPNVGKSTLFNNLTRSRDALVADYAGLTRDRKYGTGRVGEIPYLVVDTGGLSGLDQGIDVEMAQQAQEAIGEADAVLFMVDAREGMNAADENIASYLRQCGKSVTLVLNKTDGLDPEMAAVDFYAMGLGDPVAIAASHGRGVHALIDEVLLQFPPPEESGPEDEQGIRVAVVGRPNVGKSTLVNRILGEERVVVFDMPGTTRDSIYIPFERDEQQYTLIDTAGVRRRARIKEAIEKFSIIKTLQAISDAHVVVMVIDAREGISDQDAHLLGMTMEAGRALVIAINKWDNLPKEQKEAIKNELKLKLPFIDFARIHYISALHGTGVGELFGSINRAYASAMRKLSTPELTKLLESLLMTHQPPMVNGRRIKLRYAHQGGKNPPVIVIHGNQVDDIPKSYKRYLEKGFRKYLKLEGTPIRVEFKGSKNPYADEKRRSELPNRLLVKKRKISDFTKRQKRKGKK
ncbi:MAG: ribosome biogenesis GTPase Der [Pseudomonadota bacterium]